MYFNEFSFGKRNIRKIIMGKRNNLCVNTTMLSMCKSWSDSRACLFICNQFLNIKKLPRDSFELTFSDVHYSRTDSKLALKLRPRENLNQVIKF